MSNELTFLANNIAITIDLSSLNLAGDETPEQIIEALIEKGLIEIQDDDNYCFGNLYIDEMSFI